MWNLPLWGHRPLIFFIGLWAFVMLAFSDRYSKLTSNYKFLAWSTLSGLLLGFGFPVSPLTPLMFIGFVPLLMIEKEIAESRPEPAKWEVFKYAYHAFVVWNIISTYWVANAASFAASFIAIWLNSFFMTIPFILFHQTRKMMPRNFMYIAFIVNWMAWEFLHLRWEISWPWLTLGNSFAQYPSWVQWYEYTGVFGGYSASLFLSPDWLIQPYVGFGIFSGDREVCREYNDRIYDECGEHYIFAAYPEVGIRLRILSTEIGLFTRRYFDSDERYPYIDMIGVNIGYRLDLGAVQPDFY